MTLIVLCPRRRAQSLWHRSREVRAVRAKVCRTTAPYPQLHTCAVLPVLDEPTVPATQLHIRSSTCAAPDASRHPVTLCTTLWVPFDVKPSASHLKPSVCCHISPCPKRKTDPVLAPQQVATPTQPTSAPRRCSSPANSPRLPAISQ